MSASAPRPPGSRPHRQIWAVALLLVFTLGAYLRFDGLGEPSLWLDEILHVGKAREAAAESWPSWLAGMSADRENGSLYYATQLLAMRFFEGELGVRLMSALAGLAGLAAIFLAGVSATGSRRVGVAAAALLAVSPLHVYYSREGRPYAAVMLMAILLLLLALEHRRPWTRAAAYGLCLFAAYWGALTAPLLLSCAGLAGLGWLRRRRQGHLLVAASLGLGVGLFLFPTVERLAGAAGSLDRTARWEITEPLSRVALDRLLGSLTVSGTDRGATNGLSFLFLALAVWGGIRLARRGGTRAFWVTGLCLLPIAGWLAALVALDHWYNVRYTSSGLPAFLLLAAVGLVDLLDRLGRRLGRWLPGTAAGRGQGRRWVRAPDALLAVGLVLLAAPAWGKARTEPWEKPDWRGVAELIEGLAAADEPVIARGPWAETCIRHYLRQLGSAREVFSADYDPARARRLTGLHPRAWVISAGYRETPEFRAWTQGLDAILRGSLANLQLFYHPDFATLLSGPQRLERLALASSRDPEPAPRQEFSHSELLLGAGWSYPERGPAGMSFRWARADRAEIAVPAPRLPGPRELRLRLMPFPSPDRPPQTVAVAVGAKPLARITLEAGWQEISLPLPEGEGPLDLVTFDFGWTQSPRDLDPSSGDPRPLAVAFDFVESVRVAASGPPHL